MNVRRILFALAVFLYVDVATGQGQQSAESESQSQPRVTVEPLYAHVGILLLRFVPGAQCRRHVERCWEC